MQSYTTRLSEGQYDPTNDPKANPTLEALNRSNTIQGYKYVATPTGYQLVNDQGKTYDSRFSDPNYLAQQRLQDLPLGARNLTASDALYTPSVVSNANVMDRYIAENKKSLEDYAKKGQYIDASGNLRNSDGSFVNTPEGAGTFAEPGKDYSLGGGQYYDTKGEKQTLTGASDTGYRYTDKFGVLRDASGTPDVLDEIRKLDEEAKRVNAEFERTKGQLDPTTKALVDSIHQQYENYRGTISNAQARLNRASRAALGTSSRYAPISTEGILSDISLQGLDKIKELDSEENRLIAEARSASDQNRQKDLDTKLKEIKAKRDEKVAAATKVSEELAKVNKQNKIDSAIITLQKKGINDVSTIVSELNKQGIVTTAKDVQESLKNLKSVDATQIGELIKTAYGNGAPSSVIDAMQNAQTLGEAVKAAGSYAQSATGIVGEYNFYKRDAEARGQVPLSFDEYQTADSNRKAKVAAAANAAGLTQAGINTALKLSDDFEARSKDFFSQRDAFNRIVSSATDPSAAGDLALIFNFMKVLDPGSTVREGEFANAQNAGSAFNIVGAQYNKVVSGERLTQAQRDDFVNRATKLFNGAKKQQDVTIKDFSDRANKYGVPVDLVVRGSDATSLKDELVQTEEQAKKKLMDYGAINKEDQQLIKDLSTQNDKVLGRPLTYQEIVQYLKSIGKKIQ